MKTYTVAQLTRLAKLNTEHIQTFNNRLFAEEYAASIQQKTYTSIIKVVPIKRGNRYEYDVLLVRGVNDRNFRNID